MITIEGGRGAIKKKTAHIEKRTGRPATKVSMMGAADNRVVSGQSSREECNNQPLMGKMHVTEGGGKQEDGSLFWWQQQLLRWQNYHQDRNINDNVKYYSIQYNCD